MRLRLLPLLQLLVPLIPHVASNNQLSFNATPSTQSITLIDALSADSDYTSLLKLLQATRLVPTLNKLNKSTLFAPTNDAIERHSLWSQALSPDPLRDNVKEKLRQDLLYHVINYSIDALPDEHNLQVLETLHFPRKPVDPPSREPPPGPPWMPVPGGTLGGKPQRVRVASVSGEIRVGTNAFAQGGVKVVKGRVDVDNGLLFGVGDVLDVPSDLATVVARQSSLSYFSKIVTPDIVSLLNDTSTLTVFLPVDEAWDTLEEIERKYLESKFATDDLLKILNMHAVVADGVHWSDSFEPAINLTTLSNSTLEVIVSPESHKTYISSAQLVEPDIYASNGVLHTVSSLLIPPGAFMITPEKYLLTLNCASFVSKLHSVDLTGLINNTDAEYTILAPTDEVIELFGNDDEGFPKDGSDELRRALSYHFLPGRWTLKNLKDRMLLETALEEVGLNGGHQVLEIQVDKVGKDSKDKSVSFGGASALREPYEFKNALIYPISRPITPPSDALETALPLLDFSHFLAAVHSTSLPDRLKSEPLTTLLIPENDGFRRLGMLVSNHLLSTTGKADLEKVILHHVVNGVEYAKAFQNGSQQSYPTLEGTDVHVDRDANGTVIVSASGGWAGMSSTVTLRNMLTKTGVVHQMSDVLLPRSLNITINKLVKAAKGSTMATVITKAGMEWLLNGTAPPEGSPWAEVGMDGVGLTLLCPTDDAFKGHNLTRLYEDPDLLQRLVLQHLIPVTKNHASMLAQLDPYQTNQPLLLEDSATYSTFESNNSAYGDIVFRKAAGDDKDWSGFLVGIKDARGTDGNADWARVLSWGRTTVSGGIGGVVQIDSVLYPYRPRWYREYGAPITVGAIGVVMICAFFMGVRAFWRRDTEATYEPVGGFSNEDNEEP